MEKRLSAVPAFRCPMPRVERVPERMKLSALKMERAAQKWRDLAEQRREHLVFLYESGRWKRYYSGQQFMDLMTAAMAMAERWAVIAPRSDELAKAAVEQALKTAA
ncbi:MAG: TIGR03809 family protein [Bradyrhizobium sp.]